MAYDWIVPAVSAGATLVGGIGKGKKARHEQWITNQANIGHANEQNQMNRDFSKEMWEMTNAYNSPAQQMERLKAAGLNPHLAYGMQPQAPQPMSASTTTPHEDVMPIDNSFTEAGQAMMQGAQNYIANKVQQAQIDNMAKTREVMDAEIRSKDAQVAESISRTARSTYDLDLARDLRSNIVQDAMHNTKNLGLTTQKIEQEIQNSIAGRQLNSAQIAKISEDILTAQKQRELLQIQGQNAEADQVLKQLEIKLKKAGSTWSDGAVTRSLMEIIQGLGIRDDLNGIRDFFKSKEIGGRNLWDFKKH